MVSDHTISCNLITDEIFIADDVDFDDSPDILDVRCKM